MPTMLLMWGLGFADPCLRTMPALTLNPGDVKLGTIFRSV